MATELRRYWDVTALTSRPGPMLSAHFARRLHQTLSLLETAFHITMLTMPFNSLEFHIGADLGGMSFAE